MIAEGFNFCYFSTKRWDKHSVQHTEYTKMHGLVGQDYCLPMVVIVLCSGVGQTI